MYIQLSAYHSLVNEPLGSFHILGVVNNAAVNMSVQMSFWDLAFNSFVYMHRSKMTGSHGNSSFNFLRNHLTVFHSDSTSLHFYQLRQRVPVYLHPCQHLSFSAFLIVTILKGVRKYLTVVLTCISLTIHEIEPLFMCLLAICVCSLQKCLFKSFVHFWTGLFVFLLLSFGSPLHILDINLLSDIQLENIWFCIFCGLPFYSVDIVYWRTKF